MESPQMYDTVQTLSQLDLKKSHSQSAIIAGGQITLTAMANNVNNSNTNNSNTNNTTNNNTNSSNTNSNSNGTTNGGGLHHNGLIIKQQQNALHMQQAALSNNNNSNSNNNNNNNNNNNSILQKHMLQQYSQNDLDELTAQEITLDLQHLIDDQFREQEALGIFGDIVNGTANGLAINNNGNLQTANGVVSAAAKVLQLQQQHQQHQQTINRSTNNNNNNNGTNGNNNNNNQGYGRSALAYMPQAVHSGATYTNNSSDDNSSVGSEASTIKEEPLDPQEYRRQLQQQVVGQNNFLGVTNGTNGNNGLYQLGANSYVSNGNGNTFTTLTPAAAVLHHQGLPHLTGAHLASLKHHNKPISGSINSGSMSRKNSNKHVDKGTDEYRRRRERNNIAVRKSREKAKVRSREVEEKVKTLIKEKDTLIRRLEEMTNEIQLHKQIYMQLINHSNPEISRICRSFLNMSDHGI